MSFVTVKDFGIALNVNGVTVRQRIVRKKLVKNDYGLIDVTDPINYSYVVEINGGDLSVFDKYNISSTNINKKSSPATKTQRKIVLPSKEALIDVNLDEIPKKTVLEKPSKNKASVNVAPAVETEKKNNESLFEIPKKLTEKERIELQESKKLRETLASYDMRKREADVKLVERNAELKQMELEKKAGNTLPLDLVKRICVINFQSILNNFLLEVGNMATVTVEELGGSRSDTVRISNKLNVIFKKTVESTKLSVAQEIDRAVSEYTEIRSRGERKI
jgi:hypothetical protein